MVAHLVRLKLTLLRNGLRRSPWQVVGLIFALFYGLGILLAVLAALALLSNDTPQLRSAMLVLGGGLLVLGWWVVPVFAFGLDATLDPARFALFGVPRRRLVVGLALAALIGVPGLVTVIVTFAAAASWWRRPLAVLVGVVAAVLAVAMCIVGSRAVVTVLTPVLERRGVREVFGIAVVVALVSFGPAVNALVYSHLGRTFSFSTATGEQLAGVVGWTPFGLPWAAPGDAAAGRWGLVLVRLALAAVWVGLLAWIWSAATSRALVTPVHIARRRRSLGLRWFARLPATPAGAVAARCATYWVRDSRYVVAILAAVVVPVVFIVSGSGSRLPLLGAPVAGLVVGWSISADVSYDGSAFWLHLAAPLRGVSDRWGRAAVVLTIGAVLVGATSVAATSRVAGRGALPAVLGASLGLLLTSTAASSVVSALLVYQVQQVGESPFGSRQGTSFAGFVAQLVGWAVAVAVDAPALVLAVLAVLRGSTVLGWVAVLVGLGLGAGALVAGVRVGGSTLERRAPELLTTLRSYT